LLLGTGSAHRVEAEVDEQTRRLAEKVQELQLENDRLRRLEETHQAQQMDAVARLTGGIAHDFNNLLTVVSTNAQLLQKTSRSADVQRRAATIQRAAEHGARLSRQMLTFSGRQVLHPEPIELRQRIAAMVDLLSGTLREDIEIAIETSEGLWPAWIDPVEFERAISHIAANAREAMPNGGRFCVEARNISFPAGAPSTAGLTGDFIALTLSDTGNGITKETASRAFEPYFTTKEVGTGSGLGLAQVYGFAKQSGGDASITSELGRGTSVILLLPRATPDAAAQPAAVSPPAKSGAGGVACG